ncbi:MAG: acetyl-CoA carboxylase biotin carboxyl carrier protein [Verrucomicrobiota bacterium]|nr:acetyl-CoA carboxylase biotin carboxyl carrier protein [Verrucomicrobiota bacterium]MDQ6939702.1 acetyl-CoA carboxylase biotin carboxyl carrier protein [Verrucomicrobiota bacterium]
MTSFGKPLYLIAQPAKETILELKDIKAIIDLMKKNDLSVFEMEKDGFKLKLQKGVEAQTVFAPPTPAPATPAVHSVPASAPATSGPAAEPDRSALKDIVSPMVGTFYRAGSPESANFVEIGKEVNEETLVCIIEAMKVMNEIKAETSGTIAEIVAENGKPVQFGQVLFRVK